MIGQGRVKINDFDTIVVLREIIGMAFEELRPIYFVTGKGGVGKSTVAAGLAYKLSRQNKRVLLVEIGDRSYYADFFKLGSLGYAPRTLKLGFDVSLFSGEACLHEYVLHFLKLESLYKIFFENRVMRTLINTAPGLMELAILGKITSQVRHVGPAFPYDCIVVDLFASGHALSLLRAPGGMAKAIPFGPMGEQSRSIDQVLRNPKYCGFTVVTLAEELPVTEALELTRDLQRDFNAEVNIVCNRLVQSPVPDAELKKTADSDASPGLREFSQYLLGISENQRVWSEKLLEAKVSEIDIPLFFSSTPEELVRKVSERL